MITIITGVPGAGKTWKLVCCFVEQVLKHGFEDWQNCKREIKMLSAGGFEQLEPPPQKHCCYADFNIHIGKRIQNYYINGFNLGMPNPFFPTIFIPPYSTIFLDEAQKYYDSRMSKYIRPEVYQWFQLHRHNHYNIYMACQRLGNIDLNIRALAEQIIVMESLEFKKDKYGRIFNFNATARLFSSSDTAESYMLSKERNEFKDVGTKIEFKENLPIFNFYDSYGQKPAFYDCNYNRPFDYYTEDGYQFTLESFKEFNDVHYHVAPQGYYKNTEYDKKVLESLGDFVA